MGEYSTLSPTGLAGTAVFVVVVAAFAVFRLVERFFFLRRVAAILLMVDDDDRLAGAAVFSPMSLRTSDAGAMVIA